VGQGAVIGRVAIAVGVVLAGAAVYEATGSGTAASIVRAVLRVLT
jgi:hypothetical protein